MSRREAVPGASPRPRCRRTGDSIRMKERILMIEEVFGRQDGLTTVLPIGNARALRRGAGGP